jgi:hypothetical protein
MQLPHVDLYYRSSRVNVVDAGKVLHVSVVWVCGCGCVRVCTFSMVSSLGVLGKYKHMGACATMRWDGLFVALIVDGSTALVCLCFCGCSDYWQFTASAALHRAKP